jgi:RimJ/RimL family protein N-acetyltransferase
MGSVPGVIETPRLLLRRWRPTDLPTLAAIYADPEVMRYIADGSVRSRDETSAALQRMERDWDERGFGLFALELRETGELIGWAGLAVPLFLPELLPAVEIGWRLGRAHWGRGYATEAAREVLRYGFDEAGLERIVSIFHPDNHASGNVMRKLGMTLDRTTTVPSHGGPATVMATSAPPR